MSLKQLRMLAADYKKGQELFEDRDFVANESFFQRLFEIGRRHKIQNPDKMRITYVTGVIKEIQTAVLIESCRYGKLMYLLQVSRSCFCR